MKAIWENTVVAQSDQTIVVEGNHYFPPDSIKKECFGPSDTHSTCHWKGVASYYHVKVGAKVNADAAWYYPEPKDAAKSIKDYVAFWRRRGWPNLFLPWTVTTTRFAAWRARQNGFCLHRVYVKTFAVRAARSIRQEGE